MRKVDPLRTRDCETRYGPEPIRKDNSVECIYKFTVSFYQITNTYLIQTVLNTWEELNTTRHTSSCVHRYGYLSILNYTGIEQVI